MKSTFISLALIFVFSLTATSQLIVDHTCTDITQVPQSAIEQAKLKLHIAYGHTSHGSQVTDGMNGLVEFANNGGRGLSLPANILQWNKGGTDGALDLHDYAMGGDVGYYPAWYDNTVAYLDNPDNPDVNVIMWSWCGQVGDKYTKGHLWDEFLEPMTLLESAYPNVSFVYMTGHLNYGARGETNAANDSIRSYCRNNNKVLFDFADIESNGPDGTNYKENADDGCYYYDNDGTRIGNWAQEYQNTHTEGVDWYSCGSQHSEAFNANLKAYAAWWMFASLSGWNYTPQDIKLQESSLQGQVYPNPANNQAIFEISLPEYKELLVDLVSANGAIVRSNLSPLIKSDKAIFQIETSELLPGIYYLKATASDIMEIYKLSIIR